MKVFKIITKVKSVKTIQYIVEANSIEEAEMLIIEGNERGEGEEIKDKIKWGSEVLTKIEFIEELDN
jgi:hypothetical protein